MLREKEIRSFFSNQTFTTNDLKDFYSNYDENLPMGTLRWRIYYLKKRGIIKSVKRGLYELGEEIKFYPEISKELKRIHRKIEKNFPYVEFCIWESEWLNNFMVHQPISNYIFVEVENFAAFSVFEHLYMSEKNVFIFPKKSEINYYINNKKKSIIVNKLISEAPIESVEGVSVPKIEKIIVDLFANTNVLKTYQGKEKKNIIENIFSQYTINLSTLERYAKKKGLRDEIYAFIEETSITLENKI